MRTTGSCGSKQFLEATQRETIRIYFPQVPQHLFQAPVGKAHSGKIKLVDSVGATTARTLRAVAVHYGDYATCQFQNAQALLIDLVPCSFVR